MAPEHVNELEYPGGPSETLEDITRYLRAIPDCGHPVWQAMEVGEHGQREHYIQCDLCAQH